MAKAKTTTKTTAKKSSAKAVEAAPVNAATALLHSLCESLAAAINDDPKIAKLADSYGLGLVGEVAEQEEEEELDEEDEEFEEEEEEDEAPAKSKKAPAKKAPAKGGKKKKALTADDIIEILDGDDAEAAEEVFNGLEDEDMIREIAVTLKLVKSKAAAKTDADTLTEMIGEHFGIGEEEEEEEGIDPDEMSEEELLEFVLENKLATKTKAKKLDEDELRALVEEFLEEEEEEEEDEEEEEFDDEEEEEEDEEEFDDEDEFEA